MVTRTYHSVTLYVFCLSCILCCKQFMYRLCVSCVKYEDFSLVESHVMSNTKSYQWTRRNIQDYLYCEQHMYEKLKYCLRSVGCKLEISLSFNFSEFPLLYVQISFSIVVRKHSLHKLHSTIPCSYITLQACKHRAYMSNLHSVCANCNHISPSYTLSENVDCKNDEKVNWCIY
jgi:hypothetical protein